MVCYSLSRYAIFQWTDVAINVIISSVTFNCHSKIAWPFRCTYTLSLAFAIGRQPCGSWYIDLTQRSCPPVGSDATCVVWRRAQIYMTC